MAGIGPTNWALAGDGCRWMHDFNGYAWSIIGGGAGSTYNAAVISRIKMFQMPFVVGGGGGTQQLGPQVDTGYFFWGSTSGTARIYEMAHASAGVGGSTNPRPQWKQLTGYLASITQGDLPPAIDSTLVYQGIYQTGFIDDVGATRYLFSAIECDSIAWLPSPTTTIRKYLWHYNPWAWYGKVPQVIADIMLKSGLPLSAIDTAAFDNAFDAYSTSTGDAPWVSALYEIGCSRRVGQRCVDLVFECARHTRDFYMVNEAGQISVSSFTRPTDVVSGLDLSDGVVDSVEWEWSAEYMFNSMVVSWGSGVRVSGNFTQRPDTSDYSAAEDTTLESYLGTKLVDSISNATSIAKYGEVFLEGREFIQNRAGQPTVVKRQHYPFLLQKNALFMPMGSWIYSDSKERRFVTVRQNLLGLDWGVGAKLTSVAVTDDGQTIADCRCIERTYDFDRLTIESVLMEVPPNT